MQYLTVKIMELKTNNNNNKCLFRSVNRMKKGFISPAITL